MQHRIQASRGAGFSLPNFANRCLRLALWLMASVGLPIRVLRVGRRYSAVIMPEQFRRVGAL